MIRKVWPSLTVVDSGSGSGSNGLPVPLLSKVVVDNLHQHVVHGPLMVLTKDTSGAVGGNLVKRLTADLAMLTDPGNLSTLQVIIGTWILILKEAWMVVCRRCFCAHLQCYPSSYQTIALRLD